MTTSTNVQYNESSTAQRVPVFCERTRKLLARVSMTGDWPADLRQWLWCRNCHMEHEVTNAMIKEAREQANGANRV